MTPGIVRSLHGDGVGIVGAGLLGLAAGYRLAQQGIPVAVYEASSRVGGLAGTTHIGGVEVDRYYHAVTTEDERMLSLAAELGLEEQIRWRPLGVGFYHDGRLASMSTPREALTFPGLSLVDKARMAAFVARCSMIRDHAPLDREPIEPWVRRTAGDRLWKQLFQPLLDSKFDGAYGDLPATYLWSRTRRTAGTRDRAGREVMGWIRGGHQALADALADAIRELGGEVFTSAPVRYIPSRGGRATGVVLDTGVVRHDTVVTTMLRPHMEQLLAPDLEAMLPPDPFSYLGIVCLVARVRKSVSPYYALNITDRRIPITSVVETTHVVDPEHVGGHLLYVPHYVVSDSPELDAPSRDITRDYLGHVARMFPGFDPEADVIATQVARARVAEPLHRHGDHDRGIDLFPAPGLAMASSAHVYPDIVHGQAILGVAERVAGEVAAQYQGAQSPAHLQRSAA
jgi:protoporphyrinogen oxidase